MTEETPPPKPYGAYVAQWISAGMVLGGVVLGISHAYQWLRQGASDRYPMASLFADIGVVYPRVSWVGVQDIIDWLMACSAGYVLFFAGLALGWIGGFFADDYNERARAFQDRQRRKKVDAEREAKSAEIREQQRRKEENRARREAERQQII